MKIGEVIRKYRKEKQLTQEEMAHCLGVTAPAVNKWENGNSMPDVALLAPIARLLGISTDTLLSYKEELTDQEINQMVEYAGKKMRKDGYGPTLLWVQEKLHEYPNCDKLVLMMAQLLDSYRHIMEVNHPEQYEETVQQLYARVLQSPDSSNVQSAAIALFYSAINQKDYDRAEEYLGQIPKRNFTTKRLWALLYQRQGKNEEACRLYEEIIFAGYNDISVAASGIFSIALEENDIEKAKFMTKKQVELARLFEMGKYMEIVPELGLALHRKDKEGTLKILSEIIESIGDIGAFAKSRLYAHMTFGEKNIQNVLYMIEKGLREDKTLDFIRTDARYSEFQKKLAEMKHSTGAYDL